MDVWVWILIMIIIVAAFVVLAGFVLPKLLFHTRYAVNGSNDRGIKKEGEDGERSILFEPEPEVRKYIKSYALVERDGERDLVCKLNGAIEYVDYDIIVFDGDNKTRNVFNVKDAVSGGEYTKAVRLPFDTSYVSLMINEVDGLTFKHNVVKSASAGRVALFVLLSAVLISLGIFGLKACLAYAFGGLFAESFIMFWKSNYVTVIIAACAVALDVLLTAAAFIAARAAQRVGKHDKH